MLEDFFWAQFNTGVAFGEPSLENSYSYEPQGEELELTIVDGGIYSIFDTGSNAIYIAKIYYASFVKKLFEVVGGDTWRLKDGFLTTDCYEFPPLYFLFDGYWLKVDPSDYVADWSEAQDRSICLLLIFP